MGEARLAVLAEINVAAAAMPKAAVDTLCRAIERAPRLYVHGTGRCGLVLRTFVVRLAQLGLPVHLVGETVTLAARPGDLLLVGSGSGRTAATLVIARRGRELGLHVIGLTADGTSALAQDCDDLVVLPGTTKHDAGATQPPGSLFEQMLFLALEETVLRLARARDPHFHAIQALHANLE
jgi:6-phospho-3-hexuloisomerase